MTPDTPDTPGTPDHQNPDAPGSLDSVGAAGVPELSSEDRRLLDALVAHGFESRRLEPLNEQDRRRVKALASLFTLMHDYPVDDADDTLVHATIARIDRVEDEQAARLRFDDAVSERGAGVGGRFRLPDFITVAAVLLLAAGVLWPIFTNIRQNQMDATCANNLRAMGVAFDNYAFDHNGAMPMVQAGLFSGWTPSNRNTVNLEPLFKGGYCEQGHLHCGGHDGESDSYSYQWQLPGARPALGSGRIGAVLGDANPIIEAMRRGRHMSPMSLSLNHGGRGQNVLLSNGTVVWLSTPVLEQSDNIWLPAGNDALHRGDCPKDDADAFLAH